MMGSLGIESWIPRAVKRHSDEKFKILRIENLSKKHLKCSPYLRRYTFRLH
jgi:hypothetical protein